jgi:SAM-dependent methyltransferase
LACCSESKSNASEISDPMKIFDVEARRYKCRQLVHKYYSNVPTREELLEKAVDKFVAPKTCLLDAGCGETLPLVRKYHNSVGLVVGVDLCALQADASQPFHLMRANLESLPFASCSFDLVVSHSVFEHLEKPDRVFEEIRRVLRPQGKLIFTTPNKYYYSCIIARLLPFRLKDLYMQTVFGEDSYDHFPVYYRANTKSAFNLLAKKTGFNLTTISPILHYPFYLMFSPTLFRVGMLYDWITTRFGLDFLQSNWLVVMERT